jgi:type IV secretory pathway component VirB8
MSDTQENLGSFFKENSKLLKEYFETRMKIYRLRAIRLLSKSAGYFFWIIISIFLFFLFIIFFGVVLSLWFSKITGSYIAGFSITTGIILLMIILLAIFRKSLFVNPIIKAFISRSEEDSEEDQF